MNNKKLFWIIFGIFILSRVFFLPNFFWFDESGWAIDAKNFDGLKYTPTHIPHMPLGIILYSINHKLFSNILGDNISIRLIPLIFGILTFFLIYKFTKEYYNKKTALIAIGIYTVSFWAFLSNIMIDQDGCVVTFLTFLIIYLFKKSDKIFINIFIGFLLALLSMTRIISGFILLGILIIYALIKLHQNKYKDFTEMENIILIIFSFIIFFITIFKILLFYNYDFYWNLLMNIFSAGGRGYSLRQVALFGYAFFIFMVIFIIPFFKKSIYNKKNMLFIMIIFIYTFLIAGKTLDPGRYLMILIPFLTIILADFLYNSKKNFESFIIPGGLQFIAFCLINVLCINYIPNGVIDYLKNILNVESAFIIVGSSIRPFYLSNAIVICLIVFIITNLYLYIFKNKHEACIILFGIFITFNIFIIIVYQTQNDISSTGKDMIKYCKENCDLNKTFYVDYPNYEAVEFYLDVNVIKLPQINSYTYGNNYTSLSQHLYNTTTYNHSNSYIFIINYLNDSVKMKELVFDKCKILYDDIGQIYECGEKI